MTARPLEPLVRTVSVRVPHRTWRQLEALARTHGRTLSEVARDMFACQLATLRDATQRTGARHAT